jgi:hypothetical protein
MKSFHLQPNHLGDLSGDARGQRSMSWNREDARLDFVDVYVVLGADAN